MLTVIYLVGPPFYRCTEAQRGEETSQALQTSPLRVLWEQDTSSALESEFCPWPGAPAQAGREATGPSGWRRPPALHHPGRHRAGGTGLAVRFI